MTELRLNPAFNDFVRNQMIHDARDLLDHINGALNKWDLSQYKLTGESIPFVVGAVQNFLDEMHAATAQRSFFFDQKFIPEDDAETRRANADLTMQNFICTELRNQFMQHAPQNVFRAETLMLEPAVKIWALQLLEKSMERHANVVGGLSAEYRDAFTASGQAIFCSTARSFVHSVGQIFVRTQKPIDMGMHPYLYNNLVRDFYVGEIPLKRSVPSTIADYILIELQDCMKMIADTAKPRPAND